MTKYVFGIDLGTTYSCIAHVDDTGIPTVIKNSDGSNTTPSVVNFSSPSEVVVGEVAKDTAVLEPNTTVSLVKTLMGKSDFAINYNDRGISPVEVSAYILKKIAKDASEQIGEEVKDVVITCPAYFGTSERQATKDAGEIAGLNVLEIISEPVAAAIYYGCTKEQEEKTILVYDLGGGTFDVTIMRISSDKISVVCSDGDHDLGGKNWDEKLINYLSDQFREETDYDNEFDEYAQQDLRLKAEKAKVQLSQKEKTAVMIDVDGSKSRIEVTRDVFDEITNDLLNTSLEKTDEAIKVAKDKGFNVDEILLVGGSTKMPQVKKALVAKYGIEPKILEPDEAVAKGASVYAVSIYNEGKKIEFGGYDNIPEEERTPDVMGAGGKLLVDGLCTQCSPMKIEVATTKSFAVDAIVEGTGKEMCCNLIKKNMSMPDGVIEVNRTFGTLYDNQREVLFKVYESDNMEDIYDIDETCYLGEALLEGLPSNLPKYSPIEVTFILNKEGILEMTGREPSSNKEVKITLQTQGVMSVEEKNEIRKIVFKVDTT